MVIVLNPRSAQGKAQRRWQSIEPLLRKKFPGAEFFVMNGKTSLDAFLRRKINAGERAFVAAGGDGTVNALLQALLDRSAPAEARNFKIGAIALGSSNDFHKPFAARNGSLPVPCKIEFDSARLQDVGRLVFEDTDGRRQRRYWINNASVGITAQANAFFNAPDRVLHRLKKYRSNLAIVYAALHTIFTYRNLPMTVCFDGQESRSIQVTNLGLVKNPHFSGSFCYDSPYEKNSGFFFAHLCYEMSLFRTLNTLWHLSRREFSGLPNTASFRLKHLTVTAQTPFAVEYDGDTITTRRAEFSVLKEYIGVCQR
jgi:diacylglycerol kinase family enzyme